MPTSPLRGKVVVITGASSGIGAALAVRVANRGGRVALLARRAEALQIVAAACGAEALAIPTDVTRRAEVQAAFDTTLARFGRVDTWVNNAGRGITRQVADITDEDLDDMMLVNVKSALYGMQVVLPHLKAHKQGHIVNVSSMLGRIPFASVRAAYSASKHALNSLTANLRMDLRAEFPNIHVSSVFPGVVATDFGLNARHGGPDSRSFPSAQPVEEVAEAMVTLLEEPRAELYTRPGYKEQVKGYYTAEDIAVVEAALAMPMRLPGK